MEFLQDDAGNEDAVECGWRQPLEEDGASSRFCLRWSQALCPPEMSYDEIQIPMVMASKGGTFVRWWSYEDGASSMRWVLLCIRDTQSSQALPPFWGYNKKTVTRKDPEWPRCGNPFPLFISLWYFVIANPEGLRQHPNNLQKVQLTSCYLYKGAKHWSCLV